MPIFDNAAEATRKQNLKLLEDKRVRFAEMMAQKGYRPDRMIFCSDEVGSYTALTRIDNKCALIVAPKFGTEEDFELFFPDLTKIEYEEIFIKGTGLNGAFGFGTKGASGIKLHFHIREENDPVMEVVAGRTSGLEIMKYAKNPLLSTKRRRGDSNVAWDFLPMDMAKERKIRASIEEYYIGNK